MKNTMIVAACAALSAGAAQAGGFERSGLPLGFMFEAGTYAELSYGSVNPSVSGQTNALFPGALGGAGLRSGDVAGSYSTVGLAFKTDLSDKLALGLTIDPSFGADVLYPTGSNYPLRGSNARLRGETLALIAKYKVTDNVSVIGGLRSVGIGGNVSLSTTTLPAAPGVPVNFYNASFGYTRDIGYVIGVAYEKPEIALRVGLTYASSTTHDLPVTGVALSSLGPVAFTSSTEVELPKSLTLDFQSGVAADTLVFGSIRWVDWTSTTLIAPNAGTANPLVSYSKDTITYSLGVGRKFSDAFSGAISIGYETSAGGVVGNLGPTDGFRSIQVGGTYTHENMKITAGVRYVDVGDATALGGAGSFSGNKAIGVGVKVGFTF
ncbi:MAG: outer membrane protein transport protein [Cypionkella sp.]|jgi:long-subunit fatty acid transport protein|nr:outer membrane protein transport protein [Cypionkella sp.]